MTSVETEDCCCRCNGLPVTQVLHNRGVTFPLCSNCAEVLGRKFDIPRRELPRFIEDPNQRPYIWDCEEN